MRTFYLELIFLQLILLSCSNEKNENFEDFKLIQEESNLIMDSNVKKIGEHIEYFDADYVITKIYQIPARNCLEFLEKINVNGDSLNTKGYWRRKGDYVIFYHNNKNSNDNLSMEYSINSHILIVNWYHN